MPKNLLRGSIPSEVAALPQLEFFNLAENELTGQLPLFSSSSIKKVLLSKNEFVGTLPASMGVHDCEEMTEFDVAKNAIVGTIPNTFSKMAKLRLFSVSDNKISGTIPDGLNNARKLKYLYLDKNSLIGPIPLSIAESQSQLEEVWLQGNMLSGTVPTSIASMALLKNFYIEGNKFTGTIPDQICRPGLNMDFFEGVDVTEKNFCDAVGCPVGSITFDGSYPCKVCPNKDINRYLGQQGRCADLKPSEILKDLYESAGGQDWLNGISWDRPDYTDRNIDDLPIYCDFSGVECDVRGNIVTLDLHSRNLKGTLPESIGFLQYLERLDVSHNALAGLLPSDLRFPPLETLDVSDNELIGKIPPMLCLKGGVNGNGRDGTFACEHIACPIGTFSNTGYGMDCTRCPHGKGFYLAATDCSRGPVTSRSHSKEGMAAFSIFALALFSVSVILMVAFVTLKSINKRRYLQTMTQLPEDDWIVD